MNSPTLYEQIISEVHMNIKTLETKKLSWAYFSSRLGYFKLHESGLPPRQSQIMIACFRY